MFLLLFYLLLALFMSFLCSVSEAVILSISPTYLQVQVNKGKAGAKKLKNLKKNIDRPLSAILSINTVAHTIGAAGVGAQAVKVFGEVYFGVISAILTILILVFSEIIPKTIGARYWKQLSGITAGIIQVMIVISYPLVLLSEYVTRFISKNKHETTVERDEIEALANLGLQEGVFEEKESRMLISLLHLQKIKVRNILTPRTVIKSFDESTPVGDIEDDDAILKFSRIPVYKDVPDEITGYVLKDDILIHRLKKENPNLGDIKRDILIVYENIPVMDLFEDMLYKKEHIALVVDEYGSTAGIATMEDVIETILGFEIVDETDTQKDMQQLAREKWMLRTLTKK